MNTTHLTCEQAKEIDLVDYLASLNHHPKKPKGNDYWYISPLRNERTASFKVDRGDNVWYDHGTGIGGTIIDFGIRYFNCTIPEFLDKLTNSLPFHQSIQQIPPGPLSTKSENRIEIIAVGDIQSPGLIHYLSHRKIPITIANQNTRQVAFNVNKKMQTAIGFLNDHGGYELRNSSFKGSNTPKTITSFKNGGEQLLVFEGFFDFLSYLTLYQSQPPKDVDYLILNSTAFLEKSRSVLDGYDKVRLYLDHDLTGENCTLKALSWNPRYKDYSGLYAGHKDLNEWLMKIGGGRKQSVRQRP